MARIPSVDSGGRPAEAARVVAGGQPWRPSCGQGHGGRSRTEVSGSDSNGIGELILLLSFDEEDLVSTVSDSIGSDELILLFVTRGRHIN